MTPEERLEAIRKVIEDPRGYSHPHSVVRKTHNLLPPLVAIKKLLPPPRTAEEKLTDVEKVVAEWTYRCCADGEFHRKIQDALK